MKAALLIYLIVFSITTSAQMSLNGEEIETLVSEYQQAGNYSKFYFADSLLPSGVYFYKITAGNFSFTRKLILLK